MQADIDLVRQAKQGSRNAFAELVVRHQQTMMRLALRVVRDWDVAEDVVQESFIKAYQNINSFAERALFRSWLYQITLNTAKNRLRTVGREIGIDNLTVAIEDSGEEKMMNQDVRHLLRTEVEKLPERQRLALTLRIYDDLSFKEIAEIMDCPYDTAKANYRHALMKLRSRMENELKNTKLQGLESETWIDFGLRAVEVEG